MIPAIPARYKAIAADLHHHIPRHFSPLEVIAAASSIANELATPDEPTRAHYRVAIAQFLVGLPDDIEAANLAIKTRAETVLGTPGLTDEFIRLRDAREALKMAESEVAEAQAMQGQRAQRISVLESEIAKIAPQIQAWDMDFDQIDADAKNTISEFFAETGMGAVYSRLRVDAAFEDIARVQVLRELAPAAVARLQGIIAKAQAELDAIREAGPEVVTSQDLEPIKLTRGRQKLASDPEPELQPA